MKYLRILTTHLVGFGIALLLASTAPIAQTNRKLERPNTAPDVQKRLALVIGNGAYQKVSPLGNPVNDANDIAAALGSLGFEVIKGTDASLVQMRRLIREFGDRLEASKGVGLFYYAGHGVEVRGRNFLIPVDADISKEIETEDYSVPVDSVLRQMDAAGNGFNIVILDACRNNPFARGWNRNGDTGGLANVIAPTGTYIAYAAAPGSTASDGKGTRNGVFTAALLKNLKRPGLKLEEVFKATREAVMQQTARKQVPWDSSSINGDFYFSRPVETVKNNDPETEIAAKTAAQQEREAWDLVKNSNDPGDFRIYLKEFPNGANARNARIRLEELVWQSVKASSEKAKVQAYMDEFPNGANAAAARIKLRQLASSSTITTPKSGGTTEAAKGKVRKSALGIEMVWIPPGEFMMGSPGGEGDRSKHEGPQKRVTILTGYWMGRYEVTQAQWRSVIGSVPTECYREYDVGGDSRPVVCVSWNDVKDFIGKLNSQDRDFEYRLPSEAEWEYAARAGTTTQFYWGNDPDLCGYANGADVTTKAKYSFGWTNTACSDGFPGSAPVGSFKPNGFGLYDMSGNVWEWVEDIFADNYTNTGTTQAANVSIGDKSMRVLRGGSWYDPTWWLRCAVRGFGNPAGRRNFPFEGDSIGFRLVARAK